MTVDDFIAEWHNDSDRILVHTSGSTGVPKPLWVEKQRMEASAQITCKFLGLHEGDTALLCMPLDYIAGKMMVVRALICGLRLFCVPPSGHPLSNDNIGLLVAAANGSFSTIPFSLSFAAMVPLQVWNSLQVPEERERLMGIRNLIIGGGAVDEAIEAQLRTFPNAVWSTYGMTETLSHIALRRISGAGASEWYEPLPDVSVSLNGDGCLVIDAPLVSSEVLTTNDIAEIRDGRFRIIGRRDNMICSGGIKIQAEEVERLLRPHITEPFCITKRHDNKFGEAVVLLSQCPDANRLSVICSQVLPRFWQPRYYVYTPVLPLTETGKIARKKAELLAAPLPKGSGIGGDCNI